VVLLLSPGKQDLRKRPTARPRRACSTQLHLMLCWKTDHMVFPE
jgi:hypothetical protein